MKVGTVFMSDVSTACSRWCCLLVVALTTLVVGACSQDESGEPVSREPALHPVVTLPFLDAGEDVAELDGTDLKVEGDGRYLAKIVSINKMKVVADFVGWYTGEAADREAVKPGQTSGSPGGFYLQNDDGYTRGFSMAKPVAVTSVWLGYKVLSEEEQGGRVELDLPTLVGYFEDPKDYAVNIVASPFWITLADGKITRLDELYVP